MKVISTSDLLEDDDGVNSVGVKLGTKGTHTREGGEERHVHARASSSARCDDERRD